MSRNGKVRAPLRNQKPYPCPGALGSGDVKSSFVCLAFALAFVRMCLEASPRQVNRSAPEPEMNFGRVRVRQTHAMCSECSVCANCVREEKSEYCATFSILTDRLEFTSQLPLGVHWSLACITPIIDTKLTIKVLWKFVQCVIINPTIVHLCAVEVVVSWIIGRIGSVGGESQRDLMGGRIQEVGKGVRVARPGTDLADPVGVNGIS